MTYYLSTDLLTPIASDAWKNVCTDDTLEARIHSGEIDRDEAYDDLESLSAQQMYEVADKAPSWDCFDLDFYRELASLTGVDWDAYEDIESLMDAIKEALDK